MFMNLDYFTLDFHSFPGGILSPVGSNLVINTKTLNCMDTDLPAAVSALPSAFKINISPHCIFLFIRYRKVNSFISNGLVNNK